MLTVSCFSCPRNTYSVVAGAYTVPSDKSLMVTDILWKKLMDGMIKEFGVNLAFDARYELNMNERNWKPKSQISWFSPFLLRPKRFYFF